MDNLPLDHSSAIADFRAARKKYTQKAACGRNYVLVKKLKLWLESNGTDGRSQASHLLDFAYRKRSRHRPVLPITRDVLSDKRNGCLLVFCILLELDCGHLIDEFWRQDICDKHLPINLHSLQEKAATMVTGDSNSLANGFNNLQWQFCPTTFELRRGRKLVVEHILPFYKKEKINDKGATAQLWQIEVAEEFVDRNLARAVAKDGDYNDPNDDIGQRYHFAIKTFDEGKRDLFKNEKEAFLALRDHPGMIQYLGDYEHVEIRQSSSPQIITPGGTLETGTIKANTSNIILEYGDHDLDEYFMEFVPPVFQSEIKSFWECLFDVADAVKHIHHLKVNTEGRTQEFNGWHADIKPDNILIVQGKFKLADPGFATFVKKKNTETEPKKVVAGGTETYSAPERRYSSSGTREGAVSQTIDIWSLGCVFSIAATWVVLGHEGIRQFTRLRQRSIRNSSEEQAAHHTGPHPDLDHFHNGKEVLPDVLSWHAYLRSVLRKSDTITSSVLDLIDKDMFVGDAGCRIKATELCKKLHDIKSQMQTETRALPKAIMEALLEVDEAPPKQTMASTTHELTMPKESPTIVDKRQAQKSALLGAPLKMTARRSEYLKSELSNSYVDIQRDDEYPEISITVPPSLNPVAQNVNEEPPLLNRRDSRIQTENISASKHAEAPLSPRYMQIGSFATTMQRPVNRKRRTNPPQDIFQAREEVKSRTKMRLFGRKTTKDQLLSRHFSNRDIKFLVDNAESMSRYWANAKFLLETLILKAIGQDDNGMDLSFTFGNISVQNSNVVSKFTDAMDDQEARPRDHLHTDMKGSLGDIFYEYFQVAKKRGSWSKNLTLIVLTDGKWDGMEDKNGVDTMIIEFGNQVQKIFGNLKHRPVSIEFIQFGYDPNATSRLRRLDDDLVYSGIPDIVDFEHCSGDVNKMLLGSFVEEYDDDEEPATMSIISELDLTETPLQQPTNYFPTSSTAETGLFEMPTRQSMSPQMRRNTATAELQREQSTRSSRHSHHPR
ncbi:hypothetical protein V501_08467 [Pseudogymnoascus sp. VKM F-4519 (FW-2642)]|nr:hypothetical protein V501_08467 [Pseudogymnoascus sp. VKM F-4519 (FW-2642)]